MGLDMFWLVLTAPGGSLWVQVDPLRCRWIFMDEGESYGPLWIIMGLNGS